MPRWMSCWSASPRWNKALQGKELLLAVSTGAPADVYNREVSYNVHELLRPFQQMARFTGMSYLPPFVTYGTLGMDEATVAQQAEKLVEAVSRENVQALDMYA